MWSKSFWAQTAEWAISVGAAVFLAAIGSPSLGGSVGVDVRDVGWLDALTLAAIAAGLVVLKCLASVRVGDPRSPSLVGGVPGPSTEAVRILRSPATERAVSEAVREAARKLGPGGLR